MSSNLRENQNFGQVTPHSTLKQVSTSSFQENLVPTMKNIPGAIKFNTQSRSSLLIMNMIFEIAYLDPKLKAWADLVSKLQFV